MAELPAMMLWTDAYMADTSHLTTTEHGAYMLILMAMWRAGGTLPNDDVRLARTARLTLDKWRKISATIREFLTVDGEVVTQKRLKLEFEIASGRAEKFASAGRAGGLAKSLKNKKQASSDASETPIAKPKHRSSIQNHIQNNTSSLRSDAAPEDPDAALFRRGKEVLGDGAGGQIAKLKLACGGSIPKARAIIETASTKFQAGAYVAKIIHDKGGNHQRAGPFERANSMDVAREVLAELDERREQTNRAGPDWNGPENLFAARALPGR